MNNEPKKPQNPQKAGALTSLTEGRPEPVAAQKILESSAGWAGDDLEQIIELVAATRSRSRF